ncbi:MAG: hypothetical protein ACI934_000735 [Pseudohongiellaceae bacterium]|jgi:hypothetical protein
MRNVILAVFGILSLFSSVATMSHHSFSAEFDVGRPVDITGTLTSVEWTNPHAWLHIDVEDDQGKAVSWAVEMLGVNTLVRSGMTPQTVKSGDRLRVTGFGSRDGGNAANASSVSRESGESLWSSARE